MVYVSSSGFQQCLFLNACFDYRGVCFLLFKDTDYLTKAAGFVSWTFIEVVTLNFLVIGNVYVFVFSQFCEVCLMCSCCLLSTVFRCCVFVCFEGNVPLSALL